jgi:hypothetical protein
MNPGRPASQQHGMGARLGFSITQKTLERLEWPRIAARLAAAARTPGGRARRATPRRRRRSRSWRAETPLRWGGSATWPRAWLARGARAGAPRTRSSSGPSACSRIPICARASRSGTTVFVEPEALVELNNRLRQSALSVQREALRVLAELSAEAGAAADEIEAGIAALVEIDLAFARAALEHEQHEVARTRAASEAVRSEYETKLSALQQRRESLYRSMR